MILADFFRAIVALDKHALGTQIKIAQAQALDRDWCGIVPGPGPKSQSGSKEKSSPYSPIYSGLGIFAGSYLFGHIMGCLHCTKKTLEEARRKSPRRDR